MKAVRRPVSNVGRPRQKPQGARNWNPQRATQELARLPDAERPLKGLIISGGSKI
jgi:hypothetical protein